MIHVLIVDDHPLVRLGLREILAHEQDIHIVAEASSGPETLSLIHLHEVDVIILDLSMPGQSGFELLKLIKREYQSLPVLILSIHHEEQFVVRALRAGAAGYVTKESAPAAIVTAIRTILAGERYVSVPLSQEVTTLMVEDDDRPAHETLSNREYQVFRLLAEGKKTAEIAKQLILSSKTIATYRAHILDKMQLRNNAELMRYAIQRRLVQ